jgi:glycosyltransferase involved in cell wall biosynthesis
MIKVFYDHQKFSTQLYGGISRYFANVISAIKTLPEFDYLLGVIYSKNHYIKDDLSDNALVKLCLKNPKYAYRINQIYCKRLLKRGDFDIFHPTYYDTYFFEELKKPLVVTIHDMTYERFPEYFWAMDPLTRIKRLNIERADKIIAISETTRNDLLRFSNVDPAKVEVVYHGIDLESSLVTSPVKGLPNRYLLFVGDRSGYKNFYLFINAYQQIAAKYPELKLVLTGGGTLAVAEMEYLQMLKITDRVSHVNVTDSELNFLYQNAVAFIYPSLHEGFGLPILEAFKANCPVLLSDTECFREIAKNAAMYFHPSSIDDLIVKLEYLITDSNLQENLRQAGAKRLTDFPLSKSINETLAIYKQLI